MHTADLRLGHEIAIKILSLQNAYYYSYGGIFMYFLFPNLLILEVLSFY